MQHPEEDPMTSDIATPRQHEHMRLQQHIDMWRLKRKGYLQHIKNLERVIRAQRSSLRTMPDARAEKARADRYETAFKQCETEVQRLRAGATDDISRGAQALGVGKAAHWLRSNGYDHVADRMLDDLGALLR